MRLLSRSAVQCAAFAVSLRVTKDLPNSRVQLMRRLYSACPATAAEVCVAKLHARVAGQAQTAGKNQACQVSKEL